MPSAITPGARLGRAAAAMLRPRRTAPGPGSGAGGSGLVTTALRRSGWHLLDSLGRAFRSLGLQVSGVLYLIFALSFGAAGVKGWRADRHLLGHQAASLTAMQPATEIELGLALVFLYFGLSSLLRAGQAS